MGVGLGSPVKRYIAGNLVVSSRVQLRGMPFQWRIVSILGSSSDRRAVILLLLKIQSGLESVRNDLGIHSTHAFLWQRRSKCY